MAEIKLYHFTNKTEEQLTSTNCISNFTRKKKLKSNSCLGFTDDPSTKRRDSTYILHYLSNILGHFLTQFNFIYISSPNHTIHTLSIRTSKIRIYRSCFVHVSQFTYVFTRSRQFISFKLEKKTREHIIIFNIHLLSLFIHRFRSVLRIY